MTFPASAAVQRTGKRVGALHWRDRLGDTLIKGLLRDGGWPRVDRVPSHLKLVVEKHADGYVAYPLGLARGAILGQGDTYEAALADVRSATAFHVETFGPESLAPAEDGPVLEASVGLDHPLIL